MKLPVPVAFEWDEGNLEKNWGKHNVHFKEAEEVFVNKPLKTLPDLRHSKNEERYLALGQSNNGRKLALIFIVRNDKIRIISVRDQSRKERIKYNEK